jgi:hypothetical protein
MLRLRVLAVRRVSSSVRNLARVLFACSGQQHFGPGAVLV